MKPMRLVAAVALLWAVPLVAENTYTADQAKNHIGERATVCGVVASVYLSASGKEQPTFINLDKPYPNQVFTILIWGSDRAKFGNPGEIIPEKTSASPERFRRTVVLPKLLSNAL
jgi:micrococcal nuclease